MPKFNKSKGFNLRSGNNSGGRNGSGVKFKYIGATPAKHLGKHPAGDLSTNPGHMPDSHTGLTKTLHDEGVKLRTGLETFLDPKGDDPSRNLAAAIGETKKKISKGVSQVKTDVEAFIEGGVTAIGSIGKPREEQQAAQQKIREKYGITGEGKTTITSKTDEKSKTSSSKDSNIVTDHDKAWDYKKEGDVYYTKRKGTNKWIKPSSDVQESIRKKVFKNK